MIKSISLFILVSISWGQQTPGTGTIIGGTCTMGDVVSAIGTTGIPSCIPVSASPGGIDKQIQYNNTNSFAGATYAEIENGFFKGILIGDPTIGMNPILSGTSGLVDNGDHCYAYVWANDLSGITYPAGFNSITVVDNTASGQVILDLPTSSDARVTQRMLFRTKSGASCTDANMFLLAIVSDNTTISFTDNAADTTLITQYPSLDFYNGTGKLLFGPSGYSGRLGVADGSFPMQSIYASGSLISPLDVSSIGYIGIGNFGQAIPYSLPKDSTLYMNGDGLFTIPTFIVPPTNCSGAPSGSIWNNIGVLAICP